MSALASAIGVTSQRAGNWYSRGVPAEYAPAIERATGVSCNELCPDLIWTRDTAGQVTGYHVPIAA